MPLRQSRPRSVVRAAVTGGRFVLTVFLASGCTDTGPGAVPGQPPSASISTPTTQPLTPRQRVRQLTALAPAHFNATYHLAGKGPRADAVVRMRAKEGLFRLDLSQGRATSALLLSPRGVVSCQIAHHAKHRPSRNCFLVANGLRKLSPLFNPGLQDVFLTAGRVLSRNHSPVRVTSSKPWKSPRRGRTECFSVESRRIDRGTYCFIAKPGPFIGPLPRPVSRSGPLDLRRVKPT